MQIAKPKPGVIYKGSNNSKVSQYQWTQSSLTMWWASPCLIMTWRHVNFSSTPVLIVHHPGRQKCGLGNISVHADTPFLVGEPALHRIVLPTVAVNGLLIRKASGQKSKWDKFLFTELILPVPWVPFSSEALSSLIWDSYLAPFRHWGFGAYINFRS